MNEPAPLKAARAALCGVEPGRPENSMPKRMLIDASHPEETRVVVLDGNKVEEFDFESASRRPLKGNIYLAKVTRVEPSLQAAFVEYGGNRQGFLAFPEIHPDYYQIPVADRQALIAQQQEDARRMSEHDEGFEHVEIATVPAQQPMQGASTETEHATRTEDATAEPAPEHHEEDTEHETASDEGMPEAPPGDDNGAAQDPQSDQPIFNDDEEIHIEVREAPQPEAQPQPQDRGRRPRRRHYKIQSAPCRSGRRDRAWASLQTRPRS